MKGLVIVTALCLALVPESAAAQFGGWGTPGPTRPACAVPPGCTLTCNVTPAPPPSGTSGPSGPSGPAGSSGAPAFIPSPAGPGCLGGTATRWTPIPGTGLNAFYVSNVTGGLPRVDPQKHTHYHEGTGCDAGETNCLSYVFLGLSGSGTTVWRPWWNDTHKSYGLGDAEAALALVGGVEYAVVYRGPTPCAALIQAGAPGWPSPGPRYRRAGSSGTGGIPLYSMGSGLPLFARDDADPAMIAQWLKALKATMP